MAAIWSTKDHSLVLASICSPSVFDDLLWSFRARNNGRYTWALGDPSDGYCSGWNAI